MELLTIISSIAGITVIPMFAWVILVERRLSRIEGYCKGRNCEDRRHEDRRKEGIAGSAVSL